MMHRAGAGPGTGRLGEDLQVVLILGAAAATAATAKWLGFHAGWLGPQASAGAARARRHAAPEECRTPMCRGRWDEGDRGRGELGKLPVTPDADWIKGKSVLPEGESSCMESGEGLLAQNDGSKTPSPGGGRSGAVRPLVLPPSTGPLLGRRRRRRAVRRRVQRGRSGAVRPKRRF